MNKPRFWLLKFAGILLTPLFFWATTYSDGGAVSHAGGGFQVFVFYPIPFFLSLPFGRNLFFVLAALQFPVFGFLLSLLRERKQSVFAGLLRLAIWLHIVISLLCLGLIVYAAVSHN